MWPFNVVLDDLQEEHLKALIPDVYESHTLDYKEEMYKDSKPDTRELLKDVISLANASGGHLIIGMQQNREEGKPDGTPKELVGIENGDEAEKRIESVCHYNIHPNIVGLRVRSVPLGSPSRSCTVVFVPNSGNKPHVYEYKGRREFYQRQERQNLPMSIEKIKETVLSTHAASQQHRDFIRAQEEEISQFTGDRSALWMYACPQFVGVERIDVFDPSVDRYLRNLPTISSLQGYRPQVGSYYPSLDGLVGYDYVPDSTQMTRIQRTGYVDHVIAGDPVPNEDRRIKHWLIEGALYWWTRYCCDFAAEHLGGEPVVFGVCLLSVKGTYLKPGREDPFGIAKSRRVRRNHLKLPEYRITTPAEWKGLAKWAADRIYNAYGHEASQHFGEEGMLRWQEGPMRIPWKMGRHDPIGPEMLT